MDKLRGFEKKALYSSSVSPSVLPQPICAGM